MVRRKRLILSDIEQSLIKGLVSHTDFNDQEICAIFSHLSRSINHREIGYFRDPRNPKYNAVIPSTKLEIEEFLIDYSGVEIAAKKSKALFKQPSFDKVLQSIEAIKTAVAVFNNPNFDWKCQSFSVNAVMAWMYLCHARLDDLGIGYHYLNDDGSVKMIDNRPKLWELSTCIKNQDLALPESVKKNLQYIILVRNMISHEGSESIQRFLESKFQACCINFNETMCAWFGKELDISKSLSMVISFADLDIRRPENVPDATNIPGVIQTINGIIEGGMSDDVFNDPKYSYRVHIIPRTINNKSKADQLAYYSPKGSKAEIALKEVERRKYRPTDIVNIARERGHNINMKTFTDFWKTLDPTKNEGLGFGVQVTTHWFWYERMLNAFLTSLEADEA